MTSQKEPRLLQCARAKQRNPHSIVYDNAVNEFAHLGVVAAPSPTRPLRDVIKLTYFPFPDSLTEIFVLSHDYGWSALQIAEWRSPLPELSQDIKRLEDEVLRDFECAKNAVGRNALFDEAIKGQRLYFFFLFLHFEREYRETTLSQAKQIGPLIDEKTLNAVATVLTWNEHQRLEVGLLLWEKKH